MPPLDTASAISVSHVVTADSTVYLSSSVKVSRASLCPCFLPTAERRQCCCQQSTHVSEFRQARCRDQSPVSNSSRLTAAQGFALSSSTSCYTTPAGTEGLTQPCFVQQGIRSGFLTVLSNSSDFLPYAVVASALLAL